MKNIKILKKLLIVIIFFIIINGLILTTQSFAETISTETTTTATQMTSPIDDPDGYKPTRTTIGDSQITIKMVATIIKWIRNLGVIVGVLVLTIIGVKYMMAAGAEEKAQYKETLVPVIIGIVVLLGSLTLIELMGNVVS